MRIFKRIITILVVVMFLTGLVYLAWKYNPNAQQREIEVIPTVWQFRAIDTMKLSRDLAKEKLNDPSYDQEIEIQIKNIADTGVTHVGIATPYDEEFVPFLKRWMVIARKHHLKIWYRGNWSAWEGWFGREEKMTFDEHIAKSVEFIEKHPELFENGDAFTACPECENGAQGDPRMTGNVEEYRKFLVDEYTQTQAAFRKLNKTVNTSLLSMNKDVADLVMNQETAQGVGGFVTIDHYVADAKQISKDVDTLAKKTKAKIVLGEFGAPIPDLNGEMTEDQQAAWIDEALGELLNNPNLYGLSYWVNRGGSTAIWNDENKPKKAVEILSKYFMPLQLYGSLRDELGVKINDVVVEANEKQYHAQNGEYLIPIYGLQTVHFKKPGYESYSVDISPTTADERNNIILKKQNPDGFYSFWSSIRRQFFP